MSGTIERGHRWAMHNGTCAEVLAEMQDGAVDYIITDPPYATTSGSSSFVRKGGPSLPRETQFFESWMREQLREWRRVVRAHGAAWFTIDWRGAMTTDAACAGLGMKTPIVGVWDRGGLGMGSVLRHVYECFCLIPMAEFVRKKTNEPDVWRVDWFPSSRSGKHSAEKPVELMKRALELVSSSSSDTILDPFAGIGSTGVACLRGGRHFVGIERDPEFFAEACERLRAEEAQLTLGQCEAV